VCMCVCMLLNTMLIAMQTKPNTSVFKSYLMFRVVGSRVANSLSSARTLAVLSWLRSVDFPVTHTHAQCACVFMCVSVYVCGSV